MAELLEVSVSSVDVVSLRLSSTQPPTIDVWYSAHTQPISVYFSAVHLQGITLLNWAQVSDIDKLQSIS